MQTANDKIDVFYLLFLSTSLFVFLLIIFVFVLYAVCFQVHTVPSSPCASLGLFNCCYNSIYK